MFNRRPMLTITVMYIVVLHAAAFFAVARTDTVAWLRAFVVGTPDRTWSDRYVAEVRGHHVRADRSVSPGATVVIGDSHAQGLAASAVGSRTENFGIGFQRTDQLLSAITLYESIRHARRVIILIGTTDVMQGRSVGLEHRYEQILRKVPAGVPVTLVGVPPISDRALQAQGITRVAVDRATRNAAFACSRHNTCRFIDLQTVLTDGSRARPGVLEADGVHLTASGYRLLIEALRDVDLPAGT